MSKRYSQIAKTRKFGFFDVTKNNFYFSSEKYFPMLHDYKIQIPWTLEEK